MLRSPKGRYRIFIQIFDLGSMGQILKEEKSWKGC